MCRTGRRGGFVRARPARRPPVFRSGPQRAQRDRPCGIRRCAGGRSCAMRHRAPGPDSWRRGPAIHRGARHANGCRAARRIGQNAPVRARVAIRRQRGHHSLSECGTFPNRVRRAGCDGREIAVWRRQCPAQTHRAGARIGRQTTNRGSGPRATRTRRRDCRRQGVVPEPSMPRACRCRLSPCAEGDQAAMCRVMLPRTSLPAPAWSGSPAGRRPQAGRPVRLHAAGHKVPPKRRGRRQPVKDAS